MIQNCRNQNSILKSSLLIAFILPILLITSCDDSLHRAKMEKMQGLWVIDEELSKIEWYSEDNLDNTLSIKKESVDLPCVYWKYQKEDSVLSKDYLLSVTRERNKSMFNNCHGTYYFTDANADSVVFEAPKNPLVGKYRIQIIQDGQYRFMILSNDSTYLVCSQNTFYLW